MEKPIIGFGTGRSGTVSLCRWLGLTHEYRKELMAENPDKWLDEVMSKANGDVSFWHIKYLDHWLNQDVTRIVLMRDREQTVESLHGFTRGFWEQEFPDFDFSRRDECYRYWDWYYDTILEHEDKFIIISPEQIPIVANRAVDNSYYQAKRGTVV